jgi:hypothetical protein
LQARAAGIVTDMAAHVISLVPAEEDRLSSFAKQELAHQVILFRLLLQAAAVEMVSPTADVTQVRQAIVVVL